MPESEPIQMTNRILSGEKFSTVLIPDKPSVPDILTGFILTKTGVVIKRSDYPQMGPNVVARADRRLSVGLKTESIPLYDPKVQSPNFLQRVISESDLDGHIKKRLKRLALHAELYRRYRPSEWWRVGIDLPDDNIANSFHRHLALQLLLVADEPVRAYNQCIKSLNEFLSEERVTLFVFKQEYDVSLTPTDQLNIPTFPITTTVPVFKNTIDELDRIENVQFGFDLGNLALLRSTHLGLVVGGSKHSGKSTFAFSLNQAIREVVNLGVAAGVLDEQEVKIEACDLDGSAPTLKYIALGIKPPIERKKPWDLPILLETRRQFVDALRRNNVTIGDLPGGKPDEFTELLVYLARYSIVIDKDYEESMKFWQDYFLGPDFPTPLVGAHSRINQPDRKSGIRSYNSNATGKLARSFLGGRVVNLDLVPQPDDPFISFTAKVLLLDYLPQAIRARNEYKRNLRRSLGLIN